MLAGIHKRKWNKEKITDPLERSLWHHPSPFEGWCNNDLTFKLVLSTITYNMWITPNLCILWSQMPQVTNCILALCKQVISNTFTVTWDLYKKRRPCVRLLSDSRVLICANMWRIVLAFLVRSLYISRGSYSQEGSLELLCWS